MDLPRPLRGNLSVWGQAREAGGKEEAKKCLPKDGNRPRGSWRTRKEVSRRERHWQGGRQEFRAGKFDIVLSVVCWAVW